MRSFVGLNLAFLVVLVLTGLFTGIAFAAQPNQGYVKYSVSLSGGQTGLQPNSFTLNESVVPTSQKGFVDLGLLFSSSNTNLSFSRILNVTSLPQIFPYLPGINGTYSFQSHGMTISA